MPEVYAVLVWCGVQSENPSQELRIHQLRHLWNIGVNKCLVTVRGYRYNAPIPDDMTDFARLEGEESGSFCVFGQHKIHQKMLGKIPRNAWVMTPDEDEFPAISNVNDVATLAEAGGSNAVAGYLLDCFDADGKLRDVSSDPLDMQFPLRMRFTRDVVKGGDSKVVMWKNHLTSTWGHHHLESGTIEYPEKFPVLHYKWTSNLPERVKAIQQTAKDKNYPWDHSEYQRTLDAMEERKDGWYIKRSAMEGCKPI